MKTVFKNCILLDGTKNMAPIEHTDVVTNGDKIVFIGKAEEKAAQSNSAFKNCAFVRRYAQFYAQNVPFLRHAGAYVRRYHNTHCRRT